ncbi:RNA polymerase sigma factor [Anaerostipes sp.]|uniref:RNA polymerase sigma factor n=1 Tax=Anaerostipes sp. TaxID=1872530 RepID=UPI0025C50326|nr:sigma-70 family RNA polymerase sigma factor [Anaerostipes sp.]MBS7007178.1 sigma-70 family RNA polymerase sigma factor [Anaerostipes sp.]
MREKRYEELVPYVEQAKQGSEEAFAYLYEATIEPTRYFVYNFCKNKNKVEDILQEIYLEVYRSLPNLKDSMAFCAWQRQITYHCCVKSIKENEEAFIGDENIEFIKSLTDESESPQDVVLQNEKSELLEKCIQQLPEKQRAALLLYSFRQMRMKEIGDVLDCKENAVKNLLYNARRNLKKQIAELPKEDREVLNIRSFGFFTLYPVLRNTLSYSSKKGAKQGVLALKKIIVGAAVAAGAGAAGVLLFGGEELSEQDFGSLKFSGPQLETKDLSGITIPKKKVIKKQVYVPVDVSKIKISKKREQIEIYVTGDVDYKGTYAETVGGKKVKPQEFNGEKKVFYFSVFMKDFVFHLKSKSGTEEVFDFRQKT